MTAGGDDMVDLIGHGNRDSGKHAVDAPEAGIPRAASHRAPLRRAAVVLVLAVGGVGTGGVAVASAADGWRELPPYEAPAGVATCLRGAGPGHVTLLGGFAARHADIALLAIGDDGLAPASSTRFPGLLSCPEAAAGTGSAPLLAGDAAGRRGREVWQIRRVVADAGSRPRVLRDNALTDFGPTAVATAGGSGAAATSRDVAGAGAAVVAWSEKRPGRTGPRQLLARTRPSATAPFGPARRIGRGAEEVVAGIDGAGRAHVAWVLGDRLHVASAGPGRAFAISLRSRPLVGPGEPPALAVAPDGRALAVAGHRSAAAVWELAPGARDWRRVKLPHVHGEEYAVALQPGGDAVVAGFEQSYDAEIDLIRPGKPPAGDGGVAISRRSRTGAFSAAQTLPDGGPRAGATGLLLFSGASEPGEVAPPREWRQPQLRAALSPTGELVVTWVLGGAQGQPPVAYAAHGTLAAGLGAPRRLGGDCRAIADLTPVTLADGRLAVAWTDHGRDKLIAEESFEPGAGRLHVAVPDANAQPPLPAAVVPSVSVEATAHTLDPSADLPLRVRCDGGPCEVRVHATAPANATGRRHMGTETVGSSVLVGTAAGETKEVALDTVDGWSFVRPGRTGSAPLAMTVCTPDGSAATATASAELTTRPLPPMPRIVRATARLVGDRVVVRFRLSRRLGEDQRLVVWAQDRAQEDFASSDPGEIRRRDGVYRTTIRLGRRDAARARTVVIQVIDELVTFAAAKRVPIGGAAAPPGRRGVRAPGSERPPDLAEPVPDGPQVRAQERPGRSSPIR